MMLQLPSDIVKKIFDYVGKGNFCLVGPVSKEFCYKYLTFDLIEEEFVHKMDFMQAIGRNKVTTPEAALTSFELAEHCLLYAPVEFQKALCRKAARNGNQEIVTMAVKISDININDWIEDEDVEEITKKGDLDMLLHLEDNGLGLPSSSYLYRIVKSAAFNGHLNILQYFHKMKDTLDSYEQILYQHASEGGRLDVIRWGGRKRYAFNNVAACVNMAVRGGNLDLVKWFREKNTPWNDETYLFAVQSGNVELLHYLLENGCDLHPLSYNEAVQRDDKGKALEIFEWLHQNNVAWDEETCKFAARKGNLDALIYARTNGCAWDQRTILEAVEYGRIDVVQYCLDNDCPIGDSDLCSAAMLNSDHEKALKVLKLLRKFSIPWNEYTCEQAAQNGNLEALKWARNQGCPWDECAFVEAILSNNTTTVQYCIDNGCPFSQDAYEKAVTCEDPISMLKLLHLNGLEWDKSACTEAATIGNLEVLCWLRYQNCPWDEEVCNQAVRCGHYEVLVYAHKNGCPWTQRTYAYCFHEDGLDVEYEEEPTQHLRGVDRIIKYLRKHNCPQPQTNEWINGESNDSDSDGDADFLQQNV